jgi:esterase/lipase
VVDFKLTFSDKPLMDELWKYAKIILSLKSLENYEEEISRIISELNPIGFVEKLKSNIIVIQSTNDEVLDPKLAKRFYSLLNTEKSYHEILNKKHDLMGDEKQLIDAL